MNDFIQYGAFDAALVVTDIAMIGARQVRLLASSPQHTVKACASLQTKV